MHGFVHNIAGILLATTIISIYLCYSCYLFRSLFWEIYTDTEEEKEVLEDKEETEEEKIKN